MKSAKAFFGLPTCLQLHHRGHRGKSGSCAKTKNS